MTEKLFYQDSYVREFEASVLSCERDKERYKVVLDRTAFFPEGGGQSADTGVLISDSGSVRVLDVQEIQGVVVHYTDGAVPGGVRVKGELDFEERFSKMQQHTGEHIISGLVNRYFGYRNVGFHLGKEAVTMDYDGVLTQEDLRRVEREANQAVAENLPVKVLYPDQEELRQITYRSKIEIEGQIRIVQIPGYDSCACCAPHVKETGSVGLIKITGAIHYKGGMRGSMLCGFRALEDYRQKEGNIQKISGLLSARQEDTAEAVERLLEEITGYKEKIKRLQLQYVQGCLETAKREQKETDAPLLLFEEELDPAAMRTFVNGAMTLTEDICGAFVGNDRQGYRYVLGTSGKDILDAGRRLNQAFSGKGGGKPPMIQGSLKGSREEIENFFKLSGQ